MNKQIIFNLPVKDLARSKAFFSALGFGFNPQLSSDSAAYMLVVEGHIEAMLMTETLFGSLIDKPVLDAKTGNEVIICLVCDSPEELKGLIARALAAGARSPHPLEDHGFMLTQGFEDLDGHLWNLVWMAPPA